MKKVYFIVMDTTKDREDPLQMFFFVKNSLEDVSGLLTETAEQNGTPVSEMRLFVAPDKKTWDRMFNDFLDRAEIPA